MRSASFTWERTQSTEHGDVDIPCSCESGTELDAVILPPTTHHLTTPPLAYRARRNLVIPQTRSPSKSTVKSIFHLASIFVSHHFLMQSCPLPVACRLSPGPSARVTTRRQLVVTLRFNASLNTRHSASPPRYRSQSAASIAITAGSQLRQRT